MPEPDQPHAGRALPVRSRSSATARKTAWCAALTLVAVSATLPALADGQDAFSATPTRSSDGVYQLEWSRPGPVRIEESTRPDFRDAIVVYEGADRATTLSGRADGLYHYRLVPLDRRDAGVGGDGLDAAPLQVEVSHHPLSRALAFFVLGLVVFTSTVLLVVLGDRNVNAGRKALDG